MKWKAISTLGLAFVAVAGCSDSLPTEVKQSSPPALNLAATSGTVVVKPSTMNGWLIMTESGTTGAAAFGTGPGTPPIGGGSLTLSTPASADGIAIVAALGQGKRFADITSLQYSTYRSSADPGNILAIALQFNFDADVTDSDNSWQGRLVFEPYHTNPAGVPQATWQTWDPLAGKWWRTAGSTCLQSAPCTWEEVLGFWPNGGIHPTFGAVYLKAGSSWAGFTGSVDALTIGISGVETTFDFEAETPCSSTCYVDATTGNDAFGGDTPATAKNTIQAAINQVSVAGTVIVAAGTYPENVTIPKQLTLEGAGSASTIVTSATAGTPVITITGSGADAANRLIVRDLTVTGATGSGNPGSGVLVIGTAAAKHLTFSDVSASSNGGEGIAFNNTFGVEDVVIANSTLSSNGGTGLRIASAVPTFNGLTVSGTTISNNASSGFSYNPSGTATNIGTNFSFTNTTFSNNSQGGVNNAHDVSFFRFNGTLSLTDLTVISSNGPGTTHKAHGIAFVGTSSGATISLNRVTTSGTVAKSALTIQGYVDVTGISMTDVDVTASSAPWGQITVSHTDGDYLDLGNTELKTLVMWSTGGADARNASFYDFTSGVLLNPCTIAGNAQIEAQVYHQVDAPALGLVLWDYCAPGALKEAVMDALQKMLPTGDDKLDKRIEKAIAALSKSLTPEWWIDAETLDPKDGKQVFDLEKKVVKELSNNRFADNPDAQALIQIILDADRALAVKAIADAEAAGGIQKGIDEAYKELAKGDEERAKGKYEAAVEGYKKAWENAQKATQKT